MNADRQPVSGISPAWLRAGFTLPVRIYRRTLSRWTPATCRFHPTCSAYCVQAVEQRGILVGTGLTLWRILRCQPFSRGGYDPVPLARNAGYDPVPAARGTSSSSPAATESSTENASGSPAASHPSKPS